MIARPRSAARRSAMACRSALAGPTVTTSAPSASTRVRLMAGALSGITTTAGQPSSRAARATPWAWFPDEYVITPRSSSAGSSEAIAVYAPRNLKAPIGWRDSAFSSCPRAGSPNATRGVRAATPRSRTAADRIRSRPTSGASGFIAAVVWGSGAGGRASSPGVAAAGDAGRCPRDQLLALGRDLAAAGLARRVLLRSEACQRVINGVEPAFSLLAQRQVTLLGEDVGRRGSLRAVRHLPGRLDLLAKLRAEGHAHLVEAGTGGRGRVDRRSHAVHPTLATRTTRPRPYTPGEYRARARTNPRRRHHGGRDRSGLWDGGRHGDGDPDERARRHDVLLLRQGLQARLRRQPGHLPRPELYPRRHVGVSCAGRCRLVAWPLAGADKPAISRVRQTRSRGARPPPARRPSRGGAPCAVLGASSPCSAPFSSASP